MYIQNNYNNKPLPYYRHAELDCLLLPKTCLRAKWPICAASINADCSNIQMPTSTRSYCIFDQNKVDCFVKQKENSLPYLTDVLAHSNNECQIVETLYIVDRMIDSGVKGIDKMYPVLSRFNNTASPNIQTFLAGIYRKTQVPDAFGPLVKMLIQNSLRPQTSNFDPNEEIGGAILAYLSDRFRH